VLTNSALNPLSETGTSTSGWTVLPGPSGAATATIQTLIGAVPRKILRVRWTTATTGAGGGVYYDVPVSAGNKYSFQVNWVDSSPYTRLLLSVEWRTASTSVSVDNGDQIDINPYFGLSYSDLFKLEGKVAPLTATIARVKITSNVGDGFVNFPIGGDLYVGSLMVNEGPRVNRYFDGTGAFNPPDTWPSNYVHTWNGTPQFSKSTRTPQPSNDAMVWTPNQSAWAWVSAIVKSAGMQLWCDEDRNWHLLALTYGVPAAGPANGSTATITSGVNLRDGSDEISMRQDSSYATGLVAFTGDTRLEFASGSGVIQFTPSTGTPTKVLSFPIGVVSPLGIEQLLTRAVSLGRVYDLDATPDYRVSPGQPLALTVPGEPLANVKVGSVTWKNAKRAADMAVKTQ
jgi:hypothetical protein